MKDEELRVYKQKMLFKNDLINKRKLESACENRGFVLGLFRNSIWQWELACNNYEKLWGGTANIQPLDSLIVIQ